MALNSPHFAPTDWRIPSRSGHLRQEEKDPNKAAGRNGSRWLSARMPWPVNGTLASIASVTPADLHAWKELRSR
jgi:hypothetical protein